MISTRKHIMRARTATPLGPPSAVDCTGDIHPGIIEPTPDFLVENSLIIEGIDNLRQIGRHKIQQQHKKEIRTPIIIIHK